MLPYTCQLKLNLPTEYKNPFVIFKTHPPPQSKTQRRGNYVWQNFSGYIMVGKYSRISETDTYVVW